MTIVRARRSQRTVVGRKTAELDRRIGEELRRLRLDAGVSQTALSAAAGIDQSLLSLVERGLCEPSLTALQSLATALGADLSVRLYPNTGPVVHDRVQAPILEALLRVLGPVWRRLLEVAVYRPARGVIDAVLHDPRANVLVATEVQGRIDRLEQQVRWAGEKADSLPSATIWRFAEGDRTPEISRLLVLRATESTRRLVSRYAEVFAAAYPAATEDALSALQGESPWPGAALLWADVVGGVATIRQTPPRGVTVGVAPEKRSA